MNWSFQTVTQNLERKKIYFFIRRMRIRICIFFGSDPDPWESDLDPKHCLDVYYYSITT